MCQSTLITALLISFVGTMLSAFPLLQRDVNQPFEIIDRPGANSVLIYGSKTDIKQLDLLTGKEQLVCSNCANKEHSWGKIIRDGKSDAGFLRSVYHLVGNGHTIGSEPQYLEYFGLDGSKAKVEYASTYMMPQFNEVEVEEKSEWQGVWKSFIYTHIKEKKGAHYYAVSPKLNLTEVAIGQLPHENKFPSSGVFLNNLISISRYPQYGTNGGFGWTMWDSLGNFKNSHFVVEYGEFSSVARTQSIRRIDETQGFGVALGAKYYSPNSGAYHLAGFTLDGKLLNPYADVLGSYSPTGDKKQCLKSNHTQSVWALRAKGGKKLAYVRWGQSEGGPKECADGVFFDLTSGKALAHVPELDWDQLEAIYDESTQEDIAIARNGVNLYKIDVSNPTASVLLPIKSENKTDWKKLVKTPNGNFFLAVKSAPQEISVLNVKTAKTTTVHTTKTIDGVALQKANFFYPTTSETRLMVPTTNGEVEIFSVLE